MSETIEFEESSGNVFLDIGYTQEETKRELQRSDLAFEVYSILEERKLTTTKVGEILASINLMCHYSRTANFNDLARSVSSHF